MTNSSEMIVRSAMSGTDLAKHILYRLFRDYDGNIHIRFWDGSEVYLGHGHPEFSLTFRCPKVFQAIVLSRDPLRLAESYFQGLIDVDGDFYTALKLRHHLTSLQLSLLDKAALVAKALRVKSSRSASEADHTPRWKKNHRPEAGNRTQPKAQSPCHLFSL